MEPRDDALKQSAETQPQQTKPYEEAVAFIKDSEHHVNDMQLRVIINDTLLDAILRQAEAGEVTTRQLNAAGEEELISLTPKQLMFDQFNRFIELHDAHDPNAFHAIPRVNGLRDAVRAVAATDTLTEPLKLAIMERQAAMMREEQSDVDVPIKPGTLSDIMNESHPNAAEVMNDQAREEVVEELGEQATEAVVVEPDEAAIAARRMVDIDENPYDKWLSDDYQEASVEDAAIRPVETEEERLIRERRSADLEDAANKAYLQDKGFRQSK